MVSVAGGPSVLYERIIYRRVTHHEVNEWVKRFPVFIGQQLNGYYAIPRYWGGGGRAEGRHVLYYDNGRKALQGLLDKEGRPTRYTLWNEDGTVEKQFEYSYLGRYEYNEKVTGHVVIQRTGPEWLWGARDQK